MLEWYHWTLIAIWAVALLCAWKVPRATLWLVLGAASYVISAWWHNQGLPHGVWFGAATNIVMVVTLFFLARERWEFGVWSAINMMLLIDALYVSGVIQTQLTFAMALEVVNTVAMIIIGATGIVDRVKTGDLPFSRPARNRSIGALHHALFSKRTPYRWWED